MKTIYDRGKKSRYLVLVFPKDKFEIFLELCADNTKYSDLMKKHEITSHVARSIAGKTIYWLRRLAEDCRDEEMETITLRRKTFESHLSVRQYLERYGQFFIEKIEHYQKSGRILISSDIEGTKSIWRH